MIICVNNVIPVQNLSIVLSPGQTDSQVNASQCKSMQVCKTRTCVLTCKGWPNGFASWLQVAKKLKFHAYHWLMHFYNNRFILAIDLCRLVLGGQTAKNLCRLASKFELNQSQRKASQIHASGWPNETQVECKSQTCVDLHQLASPFGQGFRHAFHSLDDLQNANILL